MTDDGGLLCETSRPAQQACFMPSRPGGKAFYLHKPIIAPINVNAINK